MPKSKPIPDDRPDREEFTQEDVIAGKRTMDITVDQDVHLIRDVQMECDHVDFQNKFSTTMKQGFSTTTIGIRGLWDCNYPISCMAISLFLSWNLALLNRSAHAPQHWELCDTEEVVREQVIELSPDIVLFQELPGLSLY